jgi:hypothetical protein
VKVSEPTTIHGSRHTQMTARERLAGAGAAHASLACSSQPGTGQPRPSVNIRRIDARDSGTERITVTHTSTPARRSRSTSRRRFSSWLATTMSGRKATIAATSGFLVPRTRGTSRSAGWVHHWVAPASASRRVAAIASVSDGTSDTTRCAGRVARTGNPRSSRRCTPPG